MGYFGDHNELDAVLSGTASGDQAEAPAVSNTNRSGPPNCRRFIWLSVALVVTVFAVVTLVIMIASMPLRLPSFTISSLSFSTASSGVLSGDFSVTLAVHNPNTKADVRFSTLVAGVYCGGMVVAEAALPPMYQVALSERTVTARLVAAASPHVGSGVAGGVWPDVMARGGSGDVVRYRVEATCSLAFHVNGVDTARWRKVRVRCDDVPVRLDNATAAPTSGKLVGPRSPCTVKRAAAVQPLLSLLSFLTNPISFPCFLHGQIYFLE